MLDFEEWYEENYDELRIEAAELGLDRDLDFDFETWVEKKYFKLCKENDHKY
jgi:hypothetical protein